MKLFDVSGVLHSNCWHDRNFINHMKHFAAVALIASLGLTAVLADDAKLPPASTKKDVTFAADIKPIFDASCVKCHSGDKPRGRFKIDTLENTLKGGKNGQMVIPGKSADSPLVQMVAHASADDMEWMPPTHNKLDIKPLTAEQVSLIRAWIDQGAK